METMHRKSDEWMRKIAVSFSRTAKMYEEAAFVQKRAAEFLSERIEQHVEVKTSIVEIGAGTGFLTRRLLRLFKEASLTAVDLSESMLHELERKLSPSDRKRVVLSVGDMDSLEEKDTSLICSSFALQWSKNPLLLLSKSACLLEPDGFLAHALPLKGSLRSLSQKGYLHPIPQLSLSMEELLRELASFDILSAEIIEIEQEFQNPLQALHHIKSFGGAVSPSLPRKLFSLRQSKEPIACEWSIGCLIARKKR